MRIRTQFTLTVALFGVLFVIVGSGLFLINRQVERLRQQEDIAHKLEMGARELSYLANDYLLHGEAQQRLRWETKFSWFTDVLMTFVSDSPELAALIEEIEASRKRLGAVFAEVAQTRENQLSVDTGEADLAMIRVSWSRIEVQAQAMAFNASQAARTLEQRIDLLHRRSAILLFALLGGFGAFFVINWLTVNKRMLLALSELQERTKRIGAGNLDPVAGESRADEIGDLSRAINRMTIDLKAVTASKQDLEREMRERRQVEETLEKSNRELEQFAYVASHDLQEPLRAIVGFLQLLETNYGERLDERGLHYIDRAVKGGHRMQRLIRDLLILSRVSTKGATFVPKDLNQSIQQVLDDLELMIREKNAKVNCADLPSLAVDDFQIQRLFQNLIVNGLRYNVDPEPMVEISCREQEGVYEFSVKDNGIGISPKFHERIFIVFQRLHTESEYPGTGLGLALCKKIVERHGGSIWLESEPGKGSTFHFTLPKSR